MPSLLIAIALPGVYYATLIWKVRSLKSAHTCIWMTPLTCYMLWCMQMVTGTFSGSMAVKEAQDSLLAMTL
jgi:hypothetical protein